MVLGARIKRKSFGSSFQRQWLKWQIVIISFVESIETRTFDWAPYLNSCSEVLKALDFAYNLATQKKPIVKRIIDILEENRAGYLSRRLGVSSAFLTERESWLTTYRERMRELTPVQTPVAAPNAGFSISPEALKVGVILGAVVIGGFILLVVLIAIGTVKPPSSETVASNNAKQPSPPPAASTTQAPTPTDVISPRKSSIS